MLLRDMVEIDRRFQNSVNLQLDIDNQKKINSYIPTRSSNIILEHYLSNVKDGKEKATILIGPYGKGKSHLLLVLLDKLRKREHPYLPVIVSGLNGDISKAFLLGLLDALKRAGLENIAPDSYFSKAIDAVNRWKDNFADTYDRFKDLVAQKGYVIEDFMHALEKHDESALSVFRKIYPQITSGSQFNPIVEVRINELYKEVNTKLCKAGYAGMFIVFDEFSKFIEGHEPATFSADMKIVQEMCELANNSDKSQIHIVFVTHKSIKEYNNLPKSMIDAFTGVEGRIKEVLFVVSSQNNYELIMSAIKKLVPVSDSMGKQYIESSNHSYKLQCFKSLFTKDDYNRIIVEGCYPLMPLTAYLLLQISEKVAQNERSIFTYLANDEKGSLYRTVKESREDSNTVGITADVVYDYFCNLFRENVSLTGIHTEWIKADYALTKVEDSMQRKAVKVMALLAMIKKPEEAPVNIDCIRCALNLSNEDCKSVLDSLVEKKIIYNRDKDKCYVFKTNVGVDIDKEIKKRASRTVGEEILLSELAKVSDYKYLLPKRHNQQYAITRYFEYEYMTMQQLSNTAKASYLFEEHFADGKIIVLVDGNLSERTEIVSQLRHLDDKRIIILKGSKKFQYTARIKKLLAVKSLLNDPEFMEDNKVLYQELLDYIEDITYEINHDIADIFTLDKGCIAFNEETVYENPTSLNTLVSDICDAYYNNTPRINNELVNRQSISSQNKKARDKIMEKILSEEDCLEYMTGTSPEATIYRATMTSTGIVDNEQEMDEGCKLIIAAIDKFIAFCDGHKESFSILYDTLMGKGFGIRKGIIPIYLASRLIALNDTPIIYLNNKEVYLDASILNNINDAPDEYYLYVEQGSAQKEHYLRAVEKLYLSSEQLDTTVTRRKRLVRIVNTMQKWYRALPQITINFMAKPDELSEEEFSQLKKYRKIFRKLELNPRDVIFENIPDIFGNEYAIVEKSLYKCKAVLDHYIDAIKGRAINILKKEFGGNENTNLLACLQDWYSRQNNTAKTYLSNNKVTNLMNYLSDIGANEENEILNRISKIILDIYVEDWNDDSLEKYAREIHSTRIEIENIQEELSEGEDTNKIVLTHGQHSIEKFYSNIGDDSTGYFLQNAINEAIEQFGDSLEMNQKVAVLVQTLEKLIQQ